mmetsp:Transcript_62918/g.182519  ORF Transcript_62918/g.182519 Transcript_62918/m.182519 type:complete len:215 (+) Transcript_62918:554-1198(+)
MAGFSGVLSARDRVGPAAQADRGSGGCRPSLVASILWGALDAAAETTPIGAGRADVGSPAGHRPRHRRRRRRRRRLAACPGGFPPCADAGGAATSAGLVRGRLRQRRRDGSQRRRRVERRCRGDDAKGSGCPRTEAERDRGSPQDLGFKRRRWLEEGLFDRRQQGEKNEGGAPEKGRGYPLHWLRRHGGSAARKLEVAGSPAGFEAKHEQVGKR